MDNYEDFISTVSHELRTPLTSIRGFAQTMLTSWDKLDDESKKKFLKIIEDQSNRLIGLVENMLSVTKLHSEKEILVFKKANLKNLIEPVIDIIKTAYPTHKFEFISNEKTPNIIVDKDKFQQIMTNLIENAAKYSNENTTITIATEPAGDYVSIKVTDRGVGILPENYNKIFTKHHISGYLLEDILKTPKTTEEAIKFFIHKNKIT